MKRRRKNVRRKNKGNKVILTTTIISLFLLLTIGYATFQTNINVRVTGKAKKLYTSEAIEKLLKSNSLTMFTDPFGNIRYTGSNEDVHNYVCLVDETPCQDKNLFRIIGSFINIDDGNGNLETRVKIVKATPYSLDVWDTSGNNNWARPATLNTTLNTTYYDSLDSNVQNLIGNTMWNLGGLDYYNRLSNNFYQQERGTSTNKNNEAPATWVGKIALIYSSDYGYASKNCYLNKVLGNENGDDYRLDICKNSNWLFLENQFFLSPARACSRGVSLVIADGFFHHCTAVDVVRNIKPASFLKSNTILVTNGHDGTQLNPYKVKLYDEE